MASPQAAVAIGQMLSRGAAGDPKAWAPVLADVPLFSGVSKRHLRRIAGLTKEARFAAGSTIIRQGDTGESFFLLLDGTASVVRPGGLPRIEVGPGDFFGEMALLDGEVRSATVLAKTDVLCLRLARQPFTRMLKGEPEIALAMLRTMAGRIRDLQARAVLGA